MAAPLVRGTVRGDHAVRDATRVVSLRRSTGLRVIHYFRRLRMQWTTPTASDFRFGFEITMYVSAR